MSAQPTFTMRGLMSPASAKVRKLIEDHLYSVGIDPENTAGRLLSQEYKEHAKSHGSSRSRYYGRVLSVSAPKLH